MAEHFHLAAVWDWEFDKEFIAILEEKVHLQRLKFYSISHHNTHETLRRLQKGELEFGAYLDRASDQDENFSPLLRALRKSTVTQINAHDSLVNAADKATMHLEFLAKGINVPFTIIVSPFNKKKEVELTLSDLAKLGRPFIIKPANTTGGGIGVILGAETLKDVIESRQHHKNDKYLIQERIFPRQFDGNKAWFRVFYVFGLILPCFWDDQTHIYTTLTDEQISAKTLRPLYATTRRIYEVCRLNFFSTEIAATHDKGFVVVDYVNEICDMRLQSQHRDGVPDEIVVRICQRISKSLQRIVA